MTAMVRRSPSRASPRTPSIRQPGLRLRDRAAADWVRWDARDIIVTVSDIEGVGDIVDTAMGAGANRIDGIAFRVDNQTAAKAAAAAVADANVKAGELAAAAADRRHQPRRVAGGGAEVVLEGQGDAAGGPGFATPVLPAPWRW